MIDIEFEFMMIDCQLKHINEGLFTIMHMCNIIHSYIYYIFSRKSSPFKIQTKTLQIVIPNPQLTINILS